MSPIELADPAGMDWKTFAASLIDSVTSLAWPAATVWVAYIFRKQIARLVDRLTKARGGGIEFEFERELESVGENIARLPSVPVKQAQSPYAEEKLREARKLAPMAPRAAIVEAWRILEFAVTDALTRAGFETPRTAIDVVRALQTTELVSPEAVAALNGLRRLRNSAVHSREFEISDEAAFGFIEMAEDLVFQIERGGGVSKAFRGQLLDSNGAVVADRLDGQYTVTTTASKMTSWSGGFEAGDSAGRIRLGEAYTLVLEDGSQGEILISRVKAPDGLVWFQGNGAPPRKPLD